MITNWRPPFPLVASWLGLLALLGLTVTMADVDIALQQAFEEVFGSLSVRLPEATA